MSVQTATLQALPVRRSIGPWLLLAAGLVVAAFAAASQADGVLRGLVLAAGLATLAGIAAFDLRTLRAPNRVVYPLAAALTVLPFAFGLSSGLSALAGGLAAGAVLLAAALLSRGSMGFGDVKAGYACGALTGLAAVLPMLAVTFISGGMFAAVALLLRVRGRKDVVAFTPFLVAAVMIVVLLHGNTVYTGG